MAELGTENTREAAGREHWGYRWLHTYALLSWGGFVCLFCFDNSFLIWTGSHFIALADLELTHYVDQVSLELTKIHLDAKCWGLKACATYHTWLLSYNTCSVGVKNTKRIYSRKKKRIVP